jgi:diacylglycerol kinase family enzyme
MMFTSASPQPVAERGYVHPSDLRLTTRRGRVAVLLNANAKRVTRSLKNALERIVPSEDLFYSRTIDEAESFAGTIIDRRYDVVMAGGGDGTIVQTMNSLIRAADKAAVGMYRPRLPDLGILRCGTGNGLASACGAGRPVEDVMRVLAGKAPLARPLQLIEERDSGLVFPFASLGYDAQLLNDYVAVNKTAKTPLGKSLKKSLGGYFYALFTRTVPHELSAERARVRVMSTSRCSMIDPETDEEVPVESGATLFEGLARSINVGTTPYYGYKMMIFPFAERRTDRFHLRISTAGIPKLLAHLPSLWNGTLRMPEFVDFLVEGIRLESTQPLPYQTGGDARGTREHLELRLSNRTFRVLDDLPREA